MRNLLFLALLAMAALSTGCNGIHKRGGCPGGMCGGGAGQCAACSGGQYAGGQYAGGGGGGYDGGYCETCGDGRFAGNNGYDNGGHFGGQRGMAGVPHHFNREYNGPQGPAAAQVAYPYYTTRGPRDYFANNPPSIGY
ncbi:hypothetical protein [Anatilimnocola floriformis]|uniref:hypothetical protein n=1 Tax=Anatilimnocola floriformis TaxID=2948575 RepID=UPI0020C1C9A0|nr:hypothetical protein [Anatilimnocola floriformis]